MNYHLPFNNPEPFVSCHSEGVLSVSEGTRLKNPAQGKSLQESKDNRDSEPKAKSDIVIKAYSPNKSLSKISAFLTAKASVSLLK